MCHACSAQAVSSGLIRSRGSSHQQLLRCFWSFLTVASFLDRHRHDHTAQPCTVHPPRGPCSQQLAG